MKWNHKGMNERFLSVLLTAGVMAGFVSGCGSAAGNASTNGSTASAVSAATAATDSAASVQKASASETAPSEEISDELYTEPQFEAGVLVFGADDKLNIYDQHSLSENYLTRSVYIGDYIYALDEEGNVSSFRFTK